MTPHGALLLFLLCTGAMECEDGWLRARSCAAAKAFLLAGLRPGQELHVLSCEAAPAGQG